MIHRRSISRGSFGIGSALLLGALAMVIAARTLPAEGMQDLGRIATAIVLATLALVGFALALILGRGTQMPRWMRALAWLGVLLGGLAASIVLVTRF